ncbi:putative WRKY transcription factor 35 [Dichanthelium oligosanthes]|uniref:Putative WRKY transcription factor 35 n=1 Tax=Dichanthelium oligosanthes TaxID=888268 RepID=A0A1E5W3V0_9POAL|nr:putative WRKY transcription factor 35 [Dichanthelium oligosanthes]
MCDFFWLSPADQGDLSDVVRASLHQQPSPHLRLPPATPEPTVCGHGSLGSHHLPEEEEELQPLQGRVNNLGDDDHDWQRQLVHGNGGMGLMVIGSNGGCDQALYPQHHPEAEGLLIHPQLMPGPQPSFVEREDDVANAPVVLDELGLDMAMAPHPHHAPSIKRRKSQTKKVVCIPAPVAPPPGVGGRPNTSGEVVPSDLWAWRKYGQKPIKGSPYPRGYYRCSSSKGCSARKQVERSRTDPSMLVITYTSDHNHPWPTQRNALAGSTRPPAGSSSSAKSHHHQRNCSAAAAVPDPTPPHRHANNVVVADNATTPGSITTSIRHQLLKQEVLDTDNLETAQDAAADHDLSGMIADMDGALNVLCASSFHSKRQQQHATADHLEKLPEEEDKQLLLDRDSFSFSFLDWVGASFGVGEAAASKGGYGYS